MLLRLKGIGKRAMRTKRLLAFVAVGLLLSFGVAQAAHVAGIDPSTVPVGFLATHNSIDHVPVNALARAVKPNGTEVSIQHIRLGANAATGWHTHPGPVIVTVVAGSFIFEEASRKKCKQVIYVAGEGFVDEGFGHVHRGVAGDSGAELYAVFVLPPGSENHLIPAPAPSQCTP
jgi:quercetin dioxygenase-like cupin family protein